MSERNEAGIPPSSEWPVGAVFADHVKARAGDPNVAILFEDQSWTYDEWVRACSARAALFEAMRVDGAPHIGLLLGNLPDFAAGPGRAAVGAARHVPGAGIARSATRRPNPRCRARS